MFTGNAAKFRQEATEKLASQATAKAYVAEPTEAHYEWHHDATELRQLPATFRARGVHRPDVRADEDLQPTRRARVP